MELKYEILSNLLAKASFVWIIDAEDGARVSPTARYRFLRCMPKTRDKHYSFRSFVHSVRKNEGHLYSHATHIYIGEDVLEIIYALDTHSDIVKFKNKYIPDSVEDVRKFQKECEMLENDPETLSLILKIGEL